MSQTQGSGDECLFAAIEVVLLDHPDELEGENVDPNLAELAHCYERVTGWTVDRPEHRR